LPYGFIQDNAGSYGNVQRFYLTQHRKTNQNITIFTNQPPETPMFATENNSHGPLEVEFGP